MSLKLIEMQIALPRTQDASKIQSNLQHHGQHVQEQIASEQTKEAEKKRATVMGNEMKDKSELHTKNSEENPANPQSSKKKKQKQKLQEVPHHPYKGNFIDFSG